VAYGSTTPPAFHIARGSAQGTAPANDLLAFVPNDPTSGASISTAPGPGLHQAIDDVGAEQAITLLISGSGTPAGAPTAEGIGRTVVNLMVQGVSKAALAKLPLTAAIRPIAQAAPDGPSALARVSHGGKPYEAVRGQVTIESLDFAAKRVRGTFALTTGMGLVDKKAALQLTNGRFTR
jgi:hypothetical protein